MALQNSGFDWTTSGLIASVKLRGMVPTSQETMTDERILMFADEQLQSFIAPMVMSVRGNYFIRLDNQVMTDATEYPIPPDAIGLKVQNVWMLDTNGKPLLLPQINSESAQTTWVGIPYFTGYYIRSNSIILFPQSKSGFTLQQWIYRRAPKLITTDQAGQISAIDTLTNEVTLTNVPLTWIVGNTVDAVHNLPGFLTVATDLTITNIAGSVVTLDDVTDLAVGYWISLSGESPIPQISPEAQNVLKQAVVVKCLEALGDARVDVAQAKLTEERTNFINSESPRVDGQAKRVVNTNGGILGWSSLWPWPWWGGV